MMQHTSDYWNALLLCRNSGRLVESRVGTTREILNLTFGTYAHALPRRKKMRRELGYMELLQLLTGAYSESEIKRVAPRVDIALFGESAVYGPRVTNSGLDPRYSFHDQLAEITEELRRFPNSRRAVLTITNTHEPLYDQPCLSLIQFHVRDNLLHTIAYFRSWDLWFGAPHDLIVVSGVAQVLASCILGLPTLTAPMTIVAANAHIYERSINAVGGPPLMWSFELPHFSSLAQYRQWAQQARRDETWTQGPMPGLEFESFPAVPKLETFAAKPVES